MLARDQKLRDLPVPVLLPNKALLSEGCGALKRRSGVVDPAMKRCLLSSGVEIPVCASGLKGMLEGIVDAGEEFSALSGSFQGTLASGEAGCARPEHGGRGGLLRKVAPTTFWVLVAQQELGETLPLTTVRSQFVPVEQFESKKRELMVGEIALRQGIGVAIAEIVRARELKVTGCALEPGL